MADAIETPPSFTRSGRLRVLVGGIVVLLTAGGIWWWTSQGRVSTDDAQVDAHMTQMASRVGGTVLRVSVNDNQQVEAGTVLVEIDPRDYQIAVDKAKAELADAEAAVIAAQSNVPITSTTSESSISTAQSALDQARSAIETAAKEVEAARARVAAAQSRLREIDANATRARRDVERLKGLLAKDEVSQQQYDAAVAAADAQTAATDTAKAQIAESEAALRMSESRQAQVKAGEASARAQARVEQAKAILAQAELNLQYTVVKAPVRGVVSKKGVNPGQVIQPGQALLSLVQTDEVWITANFKETQLTDVRPGQRVTVEVDAYGGRIVMGKVDSIAAATGARFSLLPPENATGNFVKVVQRVPVKIVLDAGQDPEHVLRPGMSVTPTVYTK
jgi:membrane fusion protein (multidrug efflux system)